MNASRFFASFAFQWPLHPRPELVLPPPCRSPKTYLSDHSTHNLTVEHRDLALAHSGGAIIVSIFTLLHNRLPPINLASMMQA